MAQGLAAFVEMNENDTKNGTRHLEMGLDVVEVKKTKAGTIVSIGIGGDQVAAIANQTKVAILLLVDANELDRIQNQ